MDLQLCFCVGATPDVMQRSSRKRMGKSAAHVSQSRNATPYTMTLLTQASLGNACTRCTPKETYHENVHISSKTDLQNNMETASMVSDCPLKTASCCIHLATPRANCENRMVNPTIASSSTALCTQWPTPARMTVERGAMRHLSFFIWLPTCWACRHPWSKDKGMAALLLRCGISMPSSSKQSRPESQHSHPYHQLPIPSAA